MKADHLLRLSGAAAVFGGLLRVVAGLPLGLEGGDAEALYTATDIFLLLGLIGIYLARAEALRLLGLMSFVIAVAALSFIGGPDANPWGFSTYQEGATVLALAMAGLSIAWIQHQAGPIVPPALWLGALVAGGAGAMIPGVAPQAAAAGAGFFFAAGFIAAGIGLMRRA